MPPGDVVGRQLPFSLPGSGGEGARGHRRCERYQYAGLDASWAGGLRVWKELRRDRPPRGANGRYRCRWRRRSVPSCAISTADAAAAHSKPRRGRAAVGIRSRLNALLGGRSRCWRSRWRWSASRAADAGGHERRQELAIRAARGGDPAHAVRTIVSEGAILAAIGVALGFEGRWRRSRAALAAARSSPTIPRRSRLLRIRRGRLAARRYVPARRARHRFARAARE